MLPAQNYVLLLIQAGGVMRRNEGFLHDVHWRSGTVGCTVFYYDDLNNMTICFVGREVINDAQLQSGHFVDILSHYLVLLFKMQIIYWAR